MLTFTERHEEKKVGSFMRKTRKPTRELLRQSCTKKQKLQTTMAKTMNSVCAMQVRAPDPFTRTEEFIYKKGTGREASLAEVLMLRRKYGLGATTRK